MEKRRLKKRNIIAEETVSAMNAGHCDKYCSNKAKCSCGSMPSEYSRSFSSSKRVYYSGQYDAYIHLP